MSRPENLQPLMIPLGQGGLNNSDNPFTLPVTDCSFLSGYYPLSDGLHALGLATRETVSNNLTPTTTQEPGPMVRFFDSSGVEWIILFTDSKIWKIPDPAVSSTPTNITGALTLTSSLFATTIFNQHIFACNGVDDVIRITPGMVASNPGFTGPSPDDSVLTNVWGYKNRLYFIEKDSNSVWYGDVEAIAGALTEVDFSSVFERSSTLLWGASWSFNTGLQNEELFVLMSKAGEIVVYSGDSPEASNWSIINKVITVDPYDTSKNGVGKLGGDLLFYTKAGIARLSQLVTSATGAAPDYLISEKVKNYFQNVDLSSKAPYFMFAIDPVLPLIYFGIGSSNTPILILNFTTGSWSLSGNGTGTLKSIVTAFGRLFAATRTSLSGTININSIDTASPAARLPASRRVDTPWLNFGTPLEKRISIVRLYAGYKGSAYDDPDNYTSVTWQLYIWSSFDQDPENQSVESVTTPDSFVLIDDMQVFEFRPGGVGKYLKLSFNASSATAYDVIRGIEIFYEVGGVY